ncbi:MAG: hypothetical protein EOM16_09135 [Bacteroidia bacterium]|nr:hypothetical protein [Bacteroidia bacterium]
MQPKEAKGCNLHVQFAPFPLFILAQTSASENIQQSSPVKTENSYIVYRSHSTAFGLSLTVNLLK